MSEQDLQQLNNGDETAETVEVANPKKKKLGKAVDVLLWVLIAVLIVALLVRAFVFTQITVSGESMMDTYRDQEVVGVSKVKKPRRGDVVVFYKNEGANKFWDMFVSNSSDNAAKYEKLIKRVVAVAGDKLWVEAVDDENNLFRVVIEMPDGQTLYENYYKHKKTTLAEENFYIKGILASGSDLGCLSEHVGKENALTVSEKCLFVMGDNRDNSSDSRGSLGEVPLSRLFGVVIK